MDATVIVGLAALLFIFYVIGKVLIALANTWVGDLLIGNALQSKARRRFQIEQKHWNNAEHCRSSPYYHIMNDD